MNKNLQTDELDEILNSYFSYFNLDRNSFKQQTIEVLKININKISYLFATLKNEKTIDNEIVKNFLKESLFDSLNIIELKLFYLENANLLIDDKETLNLINYIKEEYNKKVSFKTKLKNFKKEKPIETKKEEETPKNYNQFLTEVDIYVKKAIENKADQTFYLNCLNEINKENKKIEDLLNTIEKKYNYEDNQNLINTLISLQSKCKTALMLDEKDCIDYWNIEKVIIKRVLNYII